jgi:hypothetical protein
MKTGAISICAFAAALVAICSSAAGQSAPRAMSPGRGTPSGHVAICSSAAGQDAGWSYDTVVDPAPRPAWMERVVLICESPWTGPDRRSLKPSVADLKSAGFTVMNMYPDGFCRLYPPKPGETWPAECRAEVKAMHAAGMKALAGVYPFVGSRGAADILEAHPEWRRRSDDRVPPSPGEGCLLSPFGDALIRRLVSRIEEFDIDGFQFDGWYQCAYCRCPSCIESYRRETGREVPPGPDPKNPEYVRYMVWRDSKLLAVFERLRSAVKAVKPDAVLVNWNNNDAWGAVPSWMPEALDCRNDWVNKEWWDSADVSSIWLIKRLRGASGDRPAGVQPYMFMRHGYDIQSGVYHGSSCPSEEVFYRAHKVLAMGSIPILWPGARVGWSEDDSMRLARDLVDFLPFVHGTRALPYAICIDSESSQELSGLDPQAVETEIGMPRAGMARALLEAHIPFDVVSEHNVTVDLLARYRVVILPNNRVVPGRIAALIRDYVNHGGGLLATFETSLYYADGTRRPDVDFADLFGATWLSSVPVGPSRIAFAGPAHPVTDDPAMRALMGGHGMTTYWGRYARVRPAPGTAIPLAGIDAAHEQDPANRDWMPALFHEWGKGRVAYFPAAIDAAYYDAGYPYERMLLANAVRWAAGSPPPVEVRAPMCVLANALKQEDGRTRRTIVHLLNDVNSTMGHGSASDKRFAIREETVPISGVKVLFRGQRPTRAFLVPGRKPLQLTKAPGGWEVTVPALALHAAVVAEWDR